MIKKMVLCAFSMLLGACAPNFFPLYTQDTTVYDPNLTGLWKSDTAIFHVSADNKTKVYSIAVFELDDKKASRLQGHLVELAGRQMMDVELEANQQAIDNLGGYVKFHLLPVHYILWIQKTSPDLVVAPVDGEKLQKALKEKPGWISVVDGSKNDMPMLITASTKDLQKVFSDKQFLDAVFNEPTVLKRIADK